MMLLKKIVQRLGTGLIVLWGAATLTFIAMATTSGDIALAILGGVEAVPSPEALDAIRRQYGLDQPLHVQYLHYLSNLVRLDLGESWRLRLPVTKVIAEQLLPTLQLALLAGVIAVLGAIGLALLTAARVSWVRGVSSALELFIASIPAYVIGILLLVLFAFHWPILPGAGSDGWKTLVLPVLAVAIPTTAVLVQVLRQELEEVLERPFILMAHARGLSEWQVRWGHALRHVMIPLLTLSGFIFANLLGGAVIVELLFARQGIGRLMLDATNSKDIPVVLGITLLAALTYIVINFLVDVLLPLIDPRAERSSRR